MDEREHPRRAASGTLEDVERPDTSTSPSAVRANDPSVALDPGAATFMAV